MQGVIKPVQVWTDQTTSGGRYRDTLRNIPAREAGSKKRNNVITLFFRFKGTLYNATQADYIVTLRELLHGLGRVSIKDYQGMATSDLDVDLLYAAALLNGTLLPENAKAFGIFDDYTVPDQDDLTFDLTVPFSYCPGFVGNLRLYDNADGVCPASLLGEQCEITFSGVGTDLTADITFTSNGSLRVDPTISCSALLWQTEEIVKPIPRRIEVERWTGADPHVTEGDLRKCHQLFAIRETIGTTADPGDNALLTSTANIQLKFDGDPQIDMPSDDAMRTLAMVRPIHCAHMSRATLFGGPEADGAYFENCLAVLNDSNQYQKATQKLGFIRSELRGLAAVESHTMLLVWELLRHMDSREYDRYMEKEGVPADERRDVRLVASTGSSKAVKAADLKLGPAIGVATKIGAQKERQ